MPSGGQEEGAHAAANDVVAGEDHIPAALNVHGVAKRAELAAHDANLPGADDVERSLARSAAGRRISTEVSAAEVVGELAGGSALEANRRAVRHISDFDELRRGFDHEVLPAAYDVLG